MALVLFNRYTEKLTGKKKTCCDLFIVCLQYCLLLISYVFIETDKMC